MLTQSELYLAVIGAAREATIAISDREGRIVALRRYGPLAFRVNATLHTDLRDAFLSIAREVGVGSLKELSSLTRGACVAMSGVLHEGEAFSIREILSHVEYHGAFRTVICEDVWADLAASGNDHGTVVLASTGSNVFICGDNDAVINVGGWGSEISDPGSGFALGISALSRTLAICDGRLEDSDAFASYIVAHLQLRDWKQIPGWYHAMRRTDNWRSTIADLAIEVNRLWSVLAIPTAKELIADAAFDMNKAVTAAIRIAKKEEIYRSGHSHPVVFTGGLLLNCELYRNIVLENFIERFRAAVSDIPQRPEFEIISEVRHPIIGALAYAHAGARQLPRMDIFENLRATYDKYRTERTEA